MSAGVTGSAVLPAPYCPVPSGKVHGRDISQLPHLSGLLRPLQHPQHSSSPGIQRGRPCPQCGVLLALVNVSGTAQCTVLGTEELDSSIAHAQAADRCGGFICNILSGDSYLFPARILLSKDATFACSAELNVALLFPGPAHTLLLHFCWHVDFLKVLSSLLFFVVIYLFAACMVGLSSESPRRSLQQPSLYKRNGADVLKQPSLGALLLSVQ